MDALSLVCGKLCIIYKQPFHGWIITLFLFPAIIIHSYSFSFYREESDRVNKCFVCITSHQFHLSISWVAWSCVSKIVRLLLLFCAGYVTCIWIWSWNTTNMLFLGLLFRLNFIMISYPTIFLPLNMFDLQI